MQLTGQTSTHDLSFTPIQGSAMTNGIALLRGDRRGDVTAGAYVRAASLGRPADKRQAGDRRLHQLLEARVAGAAHRQLLACLATAAFLPWLDPISTPSYLRRFETPLH